MRYLEALFKDIDENSNKTNKIRRKAWEEKTWIEGGSHGTMRHYTIEGDWKEYISDVEMLEDDWEVYHNVESKTLFTAVFERYEQGKELFKKKTHFRDVRVREGGLVSRKLVFDEEVSSKIVGHLTFGEYIAFIADIEFKNIKFQYPHG
jgi:3-phenylpropionate/cinnamic acid dioxygenase small subunit